MNRLLVAFASSVLFGAAPVHSAVFFSEYVEGSSNNKALEIYNGSGDGISLSGNFVDIYSKGVTTPTSIIPLSGSVGPGDVHVLAHTGATFSALVDQADIRVNFNGNDAIVLRAGSTTLDVFGQIGNDPGSAWGGGITSTVNHTLRRMADVIVGDTIGSDAFNPSAEWTGHAVDDVSGLGFHTAAIPEPETYALLFAGLVLLGFAARRRII